MTTPRISVVMNTWNEHPRWLKSAVRSYEAQVGVDVELIISTVRGDKNLDWINATNHTVVMSETPSIYGQINAALEAVTGDWVCYASSNDISEPFKLRMEYEACINNNKQVCYSSFHKCDSNLALLIEKRAVPYDYAAHLKGNFVNDCALVRSDVLKKYAPFRWEQWNNHSFHDLWLRIYEGEGNVFINNPTPTWFYRGHDGQKLQRQRSVALIRANRESRKRMLAWHKNINTNLGTNIDTNLDTTSMSDAVNDTETHFVYVYVSSPSKWVELQTSIQSIKKHFQGKAKFFCVGDPPGLKDVIHIPSPQIKGRGSKPKDAVAKLKVIANCDLINEDFVYCYDDVILLRRINASWFDRIIANEYVKDYTEHWHGAKGVIPDQGWRSLFLKTFAVLTKKNLPVYNYETHLPRRLSKAKITQTLDRFTEAVCADALFNSLYFNLHYEKPDILLKENTRIKAGLHRPFDKPERIIEEIKGRVWMNYSDPALNELFKKTIKNIMRGEIKV